MLDVAEEMFGYRAGAGFRDDDAAAQLRREHDYDCPGSHVDANNSDSGPGLCSGSIKWGRLHAGDYGRNSSQHAGRVLRPRPVQLQRGQHLQQHLSGRRLVRE
jgi:hypothetical protein